MISNGSFWVCNNIGQTKIMVIKKIFRYFYIITFSIWKIFQFGMFSKKINYAHGLPLYTLHTSNPLQSRIFYCTVYIRYNFIFRMEVN